jgi:hypothetical protein
VDLFIQLFWWILASSAPIVGIVAATIAMNEIDPAKESSEPEQD